MYQLTTEQEKLVTDNMRLVYYFVRKLHHNEFKQSHEDDFASEGMIGLIKAAKSFQPGRCKFATYASRCINNELFMYLRKLRNKDSSALISSMDDPIVGQTDDGVQLTLGDVVGVDYLMERNIDSMMFKEETDHYMNRQKQMDKDIVAQRAKGKTMVEVGREMGISQSYVSRRLRAIKAGYQDEKRRAYAN